MGSKGTWAELPTEVKNDLNRRVVEKAMLKRLERQRRRSLKAQLKREGKVVVVGLDRVQPSKIQRKVLASAERCRRLQIEIDKLTDKRRQPLNQRQIIELAITRLEADLRSQLGQLVERVPMFRERVELVLAWEPTNCVASQREGDRVTGSPAPFITPNQHTTNGATGQRPAGTPNKSKLCQP